MTTPIAPAALAFFTWSTNLISLPREIKAILPPTDRGDSVEEPPKPQKTNVPVPCGGERQRALSFESLADGSVPTYVRPSLVVTWPPNTEESTSTPGAT